MFIFAIVSCVSVHSVYLFRASVVSVHYLYSCCFCYDPLLLVIRKFMLLNNRVLWPGFRF